MHLKRTWSKSQDSLQASGDTALVLTFLTKGKLTRQHLSKGCAASQKAACFPCIYYKPWKLQLLSVVATGAFDKTLFFCFLQQMGKPGADEPATPFPHPAIHTMQDAVLQQTITQIHLALLSLMNLSSEDLRKSPVWLSTSELRHQTIQGKVSSRTEP